MTPSGKVQWVDVEGRRVRLTSLDRVLYPTGMTKAEVIAYYTAVAPALLRQLADRPVTRIRWPEGVGGERFFEKNLPSGAPEWVRHQRLPASPGGAELNDQAFALMRRGDFQRALPLLERSLQALRGSGELVEAWASYNLAFTRLSLGRCDGVVALLDRSEAVQGDRKPIDRLRRQAERHCDDDGPGRGDGDDS